MGYAPCRLFLQGFFGALHLQGAAESRSAGVFERIPEITGKERYRIL